MIVTVSKADFAARMQERGERPTPVLIERELARLERLAAAQAAVRGGRGSRAVPPTTTASTSPTPTAVDDGHRRGTRHQRSHRRAVARRRARDQPFTARQGAPRVRSACSASRVTAVQRAARRSTTCRWAAVAFQLGGRSFRQRRTDRLQRRQRLAVQGLEQPAPHPSGHARVALDWTAWGGIGMATRGSIPTIMAAAGVDMLPPEAGVAWIRRELTDGRAPARSSSPVRWARWPPRFHDGGLDADRGRRRQPGPWWATSSRQGPRVGSWCEPRSTPTAQPFLDHHRIDGTPVLPGVMGMEAFAEVARLLVPDLHVAAVEDVDFRAPLKFYRDEPRTVTISALLRPDGDDLLAECRLSAERTLPGQPSRSAPCTSPDRSGCERPPALDRRRPFRGRPEPAPSSGPGVPAVLPRPGLPGGRSSAGARRRRGRPVRRRPASAGRTSRARSRAAAGGAVLPDRGTVGGRHSRPPGAPAACRRLRLNGARRGASRAVAVAVPRATGDGGFGCTVRVDRDGGVLLRSTATARSRCPDPPPDDVIAPLPFGHGRSEETYRNGQDDPAAGHRQPRRARHPRLTAVAELNQADAATDRTVAALHRPGRRSLVRARGRRSRAVSARRPTSTRPTARRRSHYLDEEAVVAALRRRRSRRRLGGLGIRRRARLVRRSAARRPASSSSARPAPTIRLLGDKVAAKRLAEQADVPVVPWSGGPVDDIARGAEPPAQIGYPRAAQGRRRRWRARIRLVRDAGRARRRSRRGARRGELAFGDPTVFLEQYVAGARHVEVQIIADDFGTAWALGVRDCSVQRRHQKVIEESASTILDAAGGAGDPRRGSPDRRRGGLPQRRHRRVPGRAGDRRVPVHGGQHPAAGRAPGDRGDLRCRSGQAATAHRGGGRLTATPPATRGYAFEARLCAEDPEHGFAPAPGRLALLRPPAGPGIRVDAGISEGDDPAGLRLAHRQDHRVGPRPGRGARPLAPGLARDHSVVEDGTTNHSFLLDLLDRPELRRGDFDNQWLDRLTVAVGAPAGPRSGRPAGRGGRGLRPRRGRRSSGVPRPRGAGRRRVRARVGPPVPLRYRRPAATTCRCTAPAADLSGRHDRRRTVDVTVEPTGRLRAARRRRRPGRTACRRRRGGRPRSGRCRRRSPPVFRDDGGVVRAGWPAFVLSVLVEPGRPVARATRSPSREHEDGDHRAAPFAGTVAVVDAAPNAQVEAGAPLVRIRELRTPLRTTPRAQSTSPDSPRRAAPGTRRTSGSTRRCAATCLATTWTRRLAERMLAEQRRLGETARRPTTGPLRCEDDLLDVFTDSARYTGRAATPSLRSELARPAAPRSTCWPTCSGSTPTGPACPTGTGGGWSERCSGTACAGWTATPALGGRRLVWMFRSFHRVADAGARGHRVLERRLRGDAELLRSPTPRCGTPAGAAGAPARAATRWSPTWPATSGSTTSTSRCSSRPVAGDTPRVRRSRRARVPTPTAAPRADRIEQPRACPQPLRACCCGGWRGSRDPRAAPGAAGGLPAPLLPDQATRATSASSSTRVSCWAAADYDRRRQQHPPGRRVRAAGGAARAGPVVAGHLRRGRPRTRHDHGRSRAVAARGAAGRRRRVVGRGWTDCWPTATSVAAAAPRSTVTVTSPGDPRRSTSARTT